MTFQPYFVWNKIEDLDDEQLVDLNIEKHLWSSMESKHFWNDETQIKDDISFGEIYTRIYSYINVYLQNLLINKYETIIIKGSKEDKIKQIKGSLNLGKLLFHLIF